METGTLSRGDEHRWLRTLPRRILRVCPEPLPTGHHPSRHLGFRARKPEPGFPFCPRGGAAPQGGRPRLGTANGGSLVAKPWLVLPAATSEDTPVGL